MMHRYTAGWAILLLLLTACGGGSNQHSPTQGASPENTGTITVKLGFQEVADSAAASSISSDKGFEVHVISPKQATRRIEPGEVPYNLWLGQVAAQPNSGWRITGLPTGQNLLVQVGFTPTVDFATGAALQPGSAQRAAIHFPVTVPPSGSLEVEVRLSFAVNPAGGYFLLGQLQPMDSLGQSILTRVDYAGGMVARDNNGDGDFSDESQLADPLHLGVSLPLLAQLEGENTQAQTSPALFTACVEAISETGGALTVSGLRALTGRDVSPLEQTLRFAERSSFNQRLVTVEAESNTHLAPHHFVHGESIVLAGRWLRDGGGIDQLWVEQALQTQLDLPPDSIVAVPSKPAVHTGEAVPVTVYVNRTARPLHAVSKLRISFDAANRYLAGSLDPGEPGGGNTGDGVWAAGGSGGFALADATRLASGTEASGRGYVEFSIIPRTDSELALASGALCNFTLVCHAGATLGVEKDSPEGVATSYAGTDGAAVQWAHCLLPGEPQVQVSGRAILLRLDNPPPLGLGYSLPYLVKPGAQLQFRVTGPDGADVTQQPLTQVILSHQGGPDMDLPGGSYAIPADYRGSLHVKALYSGYCCPPSSEISLFVEDADPIGLRMHGVETDICGGSAAGWRLGIEQAPDILHVQLAPGQANNLHAVYCDLLYDPQLYRPVNVFPLSNLQVPVLTPPPGALDKLEFPGRLRLGICELHPQTGPGYSGDRPLVEVSFRRLQLGETALAAQDARLPNYPCAQLKYDSGNKALVWKPFVAGDFNQDGRVELSTGGATANGDWTMLAMQLGATGFSLDSAADVIDRTWNAERRSFSGGDGVVDNGDGFIVLGDVATLMDNLGTQVDAWQVYRADGQGDYPAQGEPLAMLDYRLGAGDEQGSRRVFTWRPPAGLAPGVYWICPVLNGVIGEASQPAAVQTGW